MQNFSKAIYEWISLNGSDELKRMAAEGRLKYDLYFSERVRAELPGFWVDYNNRAEWMNVNTPSQAALNELKSVPILHGRPIIVQMLKPPWVVADGCNYEQAGIEALLIRLVMGQYNVFKFLDVELATRSLFG